MAGRTASSKVFNKNPSNSTNQTTSHADGDSPALEDPFYDMRGKKILVIYNHFKYDRTIYYGFRRQLKRDGTHKDVESIKSSFEKLGFKIIINNDFKRDEIIQNIQHIASQDHSSTSCLAVFIMTHGDSRGILAARDRLYPLEKITKILENSHHTLLKKPKLLFIQACRGYFIDVGRTVPLDRWLYNTQRLPTHTNFFVLHPVVKESGCSWMVNELCRSINNNQDFDLMQMITKMNHSVASRTEEQKQTYLTRATLISSLSITCSNANLRSSQNYNMSGSKFAIILNHTKFERTYNYWFRRLAERKESDNDVNAIKESFGNKGFKIISYNNLKHNQIVDTFRHISGEDHSRTSCLAIFILTHCKKGGRLAAADKFYSFNEIAGILQDSDSTLVAKPKLFFLPNLSKKKTDMGRIVHDNGAEGSQSVVPTYADFLTLYSTVEGFVSWRNPSGTWMMQELCRVIDNHHHEMDLIQIILLATRNVALKKTSEKQTLETCSTLTKFLKL